MRISDWSSDVCSSDLGLLALHVLDGNNAAVLAMGGFDQLLRDGNRGVDQVVGQQHHKGFVTYDGGGTQNGVAQSQRGGLAGIDAIYIRGQEDRRAQV